MLRNLKWQPLKLSTFDEVLQIQEEGRQKRKEAEAEIQRLENELKTKLLQVV